MTFELMSRGNIVEIPDEKETEDVTLLMPYGRILHGTIENGCEKWTLGRSDPTSHEEIFIYEGEPRTFVFELGQKVTLSIQVCEQLRNALLSKVPPPGEHSQAATILRSVSTNSEIIMDDFFVIDENSALEKIRESKVDRAAYWGIRFALARGEHDSVSRIKAWYRMAPNSAFSEPPVKAWFSLTQIPDQSMVDEIISLGFPNDDLHRVASQGTSPVVLFSRGGYIILAAYGDGSRNPLFREWAYFPSLIWNELRERKRATLRELLVIAWGAQEAQSALKESKRYGH